MPSFQTGVKRESGGKTFSGNAGAGTEIGRVWIEFADVAYWVDGGDNLRIFDSRFRNIYADAINLSAGTTNSLVENSTARNTGDDAFAIWSATYRADSGPSANNVIRNCTVLMPWRASCYAIYGGRGNMIENSSCFDTLTYPGVTLSSEFSPYPFEGNTVVRNMELERSGGKFWGGQEYGAIWLFVKDSHIRGIRIQNITIHDSTFMGIRIHKHGLSTKRILDSQIKDISIRNAGTTGIHVEAGVSGSTSFQNVGITGSHSYTNLSRQFSAIDGGGNNW